MTSAIPAGPEAITPGWLSAVLRRPVARVAQARIGEEEGFTGGGLFRLSLSDGSSLIAKLSPGDPGLRAIMAAANAREVGFYDRISSGMPVPECAYCAFDAATGSSVLLLQDMQDFRARAFVDGFGMDDARSVVGALAQVHAAWWGASELTDLSGSDFLAEFSFAENWQTYPARVAALLPDLELPRSLLDLGDHIAANQHQVFGDLLDRGPLTVLHRDCQVDNVMFSRDGGAILLDWQFMGRGRGAYDVAYALISSMPPAERKRCERDLLQGYHQALARLGVQGYGLAECWTDYRRSVVAKFNVTVMATVQLDNSSTAKRAWRRADLERLVAFVTDHGIGPKDFEVSG